MSRQLSKLAARHPDKIQRWWDEGQDGYWVQLKPGWRCGEGHFVHEWTVKEVLLAFRYDISPCNCSECRWLLKLGGK